MVPLATVEPMVAKAVDSLAPEVAVVLVEQMEPLAATAAMVVAQRAQRTSNTRPRRMRGVASGIGQPARPAA